MKKMDQNLTAILWIFLGVIARVIPHPANMTPQVSMALFGGANLSKRWNFLITFFALIASDILLSKINGTTVFGDWTFFTYSGFALIIVAGFWLQNSPSAAKVLGFLLGSSLFYWTWTNFGVWTVGALYPRNFEGLIACYTAAIPFLRNSLIGDLAWGFAFFASFAGVKKWVANKELADA
jgi:hypothetical protein